MSPPGRAAALIGRQPWHLLLPFTCVWIIKPFYQGTRLDWIALALAWPLFLVLYLGAHARRRGAQTAGLCGLTLLGAVYVPLNPEASGIFAFAAAIYAGNQPRRSVLWAYLFAINLLLLAQALIFHLNLWTWIGGGSGALLFSLFVLLNARERETNLQLRFAQDQIGRLATLAERERITRDLHDVLGHTLSLISMKSELARKRFLSDPHETLVEVQQIENISRQALVKVRETIHGYAAPSFLEELDRIAAALTSVGLRVERNLEHVALDPMQQSVFAMILQEAATNIIRHAHARSCAIELHATPHTVELVIADDGRGAPACEGFGLRGMRRRLELLGGSLHINALHGTQTGTQPGTRPGTRLRACLPRPQA